MARVAGEVRRARRNATAISALMMAAKKHHAEANAPCLMIRGRIAETVKLPVAEKHMTQRYHRDVVTIRELVPGLQEHSSQLGERCALAGRAR